LTRTSPGWNGRGKTPLLLVSSVVTLSISGNFPHRTLFCKANNAQFGRFAAMRNWEWGGYRKSGDLKPETGNLWEREKRGRSLPVDILRWGHRVPRSLFLVLRFAQHRRGQFSGRGKREEGRRMLDFEC
jgi:hypothetical protein